MSISNLNNSKANKVRTNLLLKCESEIEDFKSNITKINSISPNKLYATYCNIEINFENPYEFFLIEKKHSMNFLCKDSFIKKESELENTPFLDSESKIINKKLISDRKNKIFYEKMGNLDNSFFKLSEDTNDTSTSLNERNSPLEFLNSKKNNGKNSIKFLRQIASHFIKRKKHNKSSYSLHSRDLFKSQKDLSTVILKNSKNKVLSNSQIKLKSSKNINKYVKESPSLNNSLFQKVSQLNHANSNSLQKNDLKDKCKNLLRQNNNSMIITCNGPSFNRRSYTLMNRLFEKDKLKLSKKENSKKIFQ